MKIQIDGFDIEIETSDADMMVKVIDANGQELSNNTYSQSLDVTDDVEDVTIPGVDETEEETDEESTEETEEESTEEETEETNVDLDVELDEEEFDENKVYSLDEFKKLNEKIKAKFKAKK